MLVIVHPPSPPCDVCIVSPAHVDPLDDGRNLCPEHTGEAIAQELLDDFRRALHEGDEDGEL